MRRILLGVAGGSGSGKTTVARALQAEFGAGAVTVLEQDYYYKAHADLPFEERARINYDHPSAFDSELLNAHVAALLRGEAIEKPQYDFVTHSRREETVTVHPSYVILLEGILVLDDEPLRELMDIKLFVDTDADVRVLRRLRRDIEERGRSLEAIVDRYLQMVRPMHLEFCEPSKRHADLIIPEGGRNQVALDMLSTKIRHLLQDREGA